MDDDTDLVKVTLRIAHFYRHESCGQCTPCREGCGWMEKVLIRLNKGNATSKDLDLLVSVSDNIEGNTILHWETPLHGLLEDLLQNSGMNLKKRVKKERIFIPPNIVHSKRLTKRGFDSSIIKFIKFLKFIKFIKLNCTYIFLNS